MYQMVAPDELLEMKDYKAISLAPVILSKEELEK